MSLFKKKRRDLLARERKTLGRYKGLTPVQGIEAKDPSAVANSHTLTKADKLEALIKIAKDSTAPKVTRKHVTFDINNIRVRKDMSSLPKNVISAFFQKGAMGTKFEVRQKLAGTSMHNSVLSGADVSKVELGHSLENSRLDEAVGLNLSGRNANGATVGIKPIEGENSSLRGVLGIEGATVKGRTNVNITPNIDGQIASPSPSLINEKKKEFDLFLKETREVQSADDYDGPAKPLYGPKVQAQMPIPKVA